MAELLINSGDYVLDGAGGLCRAEGSVGLLQQIIYQLVVPKGSFPFLPDLGSQLSLLLRVKPSQRTTLALKYVTEALTGISDLEIDSVEVEELEGDLTVTVYLTWEGESLSLTVGV